MLGWEGQEVDVQVKVMELGVHSWQTTPELSTEPGVWEEVENQ